MKRDTREKNMARPYCNPRVISLLIVLLALVAIRKIDGYPYQWSEPFSHVDAKVPVVDRKPLFEKELDHSMPEDRGKEIAVSSQTIHFSESSLNFAGGSSESRVVNRSQEKRRNWFDNDEDQKEATEGTNLHGGNDNGTDTNEDNSDDEITRLIEQALHDNIFISPVKWAETLADEPFDLPGDEEGMSVKIQKPRSPRDSPSTATQTGHPSTNDKIVFPDDGQNEKSDVMRRPVPACENSTFCLTPEYYPSNNEVENALKRRFLEPVTEPHSILQRIGPIEDDNGLCISKEEVIQPKTGLNDNNEWQYILNNEKYVQTVRVEICQTRDGACRIIDDIASGYKTSCKQKYIYRQLVALEANGTKLVPFQIPSSCCCHVKFTGDPLTRMGVTLGRHKQTPVSDGNED